MAQWIRPQTLNREVPWASSTLLAAAVVPLCKALYPHCLVPWKGLWSPCSLLSRWPCKMHINPTIQLHFDAVDLRECCSFERSVKFLLMLSVECIIWDNVKNLYWTLSETRYLLNNFQLSHSCAKYSEIIPTPTPMFSSQLLISTSVNERMKDGSISFLFPPPLFFFCTKYCHSIWNKRLFEDGSIDCIFLYITHK